MSNPSAFEQHVEFNASIAHLVPDNGTYDTGTPPDYSQNELTTPESTQHTLLSDGDNGKVETEAVLSEQGEEILASEPSAEPKKKKIGLKIAIGGAAIAAALIAAPHAIEAKDAVVDNLAWAAPVLITSEGAWNTGAALMLIAAGKKVGNPFKLHSRFKEVSSEFGSVVEKPLFKTGMVTNILGELGTASILIGGSIAELPPSVWPLTIGTSVALAAPAAVAWTALWRSKHPKTERQS